ncbi:prepilin peptidase [Brevundimonas sp. AAP58]|uniref:A24 family peptidase n=1 Tax=Brevundimonas sp. AAP58 TaxID=1523422 RepID=UPI000ADE4878
MMTSLLLLPLPILVVIAALTDLTRMKIPNWISAALTVMFVPAALALGQTIPEVALSLGVGVLVLVAGMALFALRVIGGGDAKLMAAASLWLGASALMPFLIWTAVLGGAFSLVLIVGRTVAQPYVAGAPVWVSTLFRPKGDIPYGVAICGGVLMAYPAADLFARAFAG